LFISLLCYFRLRLHSLTILEGKLIFAIMFQTMLHAIIAKKQKKVKHSFRPPKPLSKSSVPRMSISDPSFRIQTDLKREESVQPENVNEIVNK
jgi:hypothetical protein